MREKFVKTSIDLVESVILTETFDTKFWQDVLITLFIIIMNAFIIPLVKYLFNSLLNKMKLKGIISDEEFRQYCIDKEIKISEEDVKKLIETYKQWKGKK